MSRLASFLAFGLACSLVASHAHAQDADAGTPSVADAPPDQGAANATPGDTGAPSDAPPPSADPPPTVVVPPVDQAATFTQAATLDHPATDETVWNISAGATLNTGNTRSFAGNAGTHLAIRRGPHGFVFDLQAIEGIAQALDPAMTSAMGHTVYGPWTESASSVTTSGRYDFFLTDSDAIFGAFALRHDRLAGLELRTQVQVGYLRNFYVVEKHRLWGEVGYDFTYDYFWNKTIHDPTSGALLATDRNSHSARFYLGYDNHLNENLTLTTGVEFLLRPYRVDGQGDFQARLNWITQLNMKVDAHFSLGLAFTLRYDSVPPAGKENVDTITVLNLIYAL